MVLTNLQRQNMPYCKLCRADRFRRYVVDCGREKRRRPMAQGKYRRNVTEPVPPCYRRCIRCEILNCPRSVGFSGGLLLKSIGLHLHIKGQIKIPCLMGLQWPLNQWPAVCSMIQPHSSASHSLWSDSVRSSRDDWWPSAACHGWTWCGPSSSPLLGGSIAAALCCSTVRGCHAAARCPEEGLEELARERGGVERWNSRT